MCCFVSPQLKYKEDYNKNVKGQWCETPYFDVATSRMAMDNLSDVRAFWLPRAGFPESYLFGNVMFSIVVYFFFQRKYTQHWEDSKDQIYFMQTDTPVYDANKKARIAASEVCTQTHKYTKLLVMFFVQSQCLCIHCMTIYSFNIVKYQCTSLPKEALIL